MLFCICVSLNVPIMTCQQFMYFHRYIFYYILLKCSLFQVYACESICMCTLCIQEPRKVRRGLWIPENWVVVVVSCIWVLGTKPGSPSSALNCWATSQSSIIFLPTNDYNTQATVNALKIITSQLPNLVYIFWYTNLCLSIFRISN